MTVPTQENFRVLYCILPKGEGLVILETLHEEAVYQVDMHSARMRAEPDTGGLLKWIEKDVVTLVAPREEANRLFERIYRWLGIEESPGSFLYLARVSRATAYSLPTDVPSEDEATT